MNDNLEQAFGSRLLGYTPSGRVVQQIPQQAPAKEGEADFGEPEEGEDGFSPPTTYAD